MGLGGGSRWPRPATEERVVDSVPHPFFEVSAELFPLALLFLILVRRYFRSVKVQQKRCNPILPKSYGRIGRISVMASAQVRAFLKLHISSARDASQAQ